MLEHVFTHAPRQELYRDKHTLAGENPRQWGVLASVWAPFLDTTEEGRYGAFYDLARALQGWGGIGGSVRLSTLNLDFNAPTWTMWLVSEDDPADPFVLRMLVDVMGHGSCVNVEFHRRQARRAAPLRLYFVHALFHANGVHASLRFILEQKYDPADPFVPDFFFILVSLLLQWRPSRTISNRT